MYQFNSSSWRFGFGSWQFKLAVSAFAIVASGALAGQSFAGDFNPGVGCTIANVNGSLWVTAYSNGAKLYDFEVGAGGALDKFRGAQGQSLLGPSPLNSTDRVIQWVTFSSNGDLTKGSSTGSRFNINQAGNVQNNLSPYLWVGMDKSNCRVTVLSLAVDQWNPKIQQSMQGRFASVVNYEIKGAGELEVHRTLLLSPVTSAGANYGGTQKRPGRALYGKANELNDFFFQAWNPLSSKLFNAGATSLDASGRPANVHSVAGSKFYVVDPTAYGMSYGVVYNAAHPTTSPVFGIVFGNRAPQCAGCNLVTNLMFRGFGGEGVMALNLTSYGNVSLVDTLVDQTYYIVTAPGLNAGFAAQVNRLANEFSGPSLSYSTMENHSAEVDGASSSLNWAMNVTSPGNRSKNLGAWAN